MLNNLNHNQKDIKACFFHHYSATKKRYQDLVNLVFLYFYNYNTKALVLHFLEKS